jgi:integrase/recombinase XerD
MFALESNRRNRIILKTLYYGGLRVSELRGLRWIDVQPLGDEGQVTLVGKGGRTRACTGANGYLERVSCPT